MAIETERACGFRKVGGLYLVGGLVASSCHRLPFSVGACPHCGNGIKYHRGWKWILPASLFGKCPECIKKQNSECGYECAMCFPPDGKHGLVWIGKKFYTPESYTAESKAMGVSKRISAVPKQFELGKTIVYLAHLRAGREYVRDEEVSITEESFQMTEKKVPAVFLVFKPTAIEKIITESMSKDEKEMEKLRKQGITPVPVPDNDKSHRGSVHDK